MNVIDAHIHLTEDGGWFGTDIDASVATTLDQMDRADVAVAGVIPIPDSGNRLYCRRMVEEHPDRFFTGYTVKTLPDDELAEMDEWIRLGLCRFMKVHPRLTGIHPLSEDLEAFYDLACNAGLPVIFDTYIRGTRLPLGDLTPLTYDALARKHPDLKIVLAHAGAHRVLEALAVAQTHENVYLEVSHILMYFAGSALAGDILFAMNKIDRKLIYGSDFPEYSIESYADHARELVAGLDDFDVEGFFGRTAARLYGLDDR